MLDGANLTPKQLQRLRDALEVGRIADNRIDPGGRSFLRGWNCGIEFVEGQINKILKEAVNDGAGR